MFADAYAKRRCIVPMDVFYEYDKKRKRHAFGMKDGKPFAVAGIWDNWRNPNGTWERTFCIITAPANDLVGAIHDRMPAIIPIEHHARWLGTEPDPRDLLRPFSGRSHENAAADPLKMKRRSGAFVRRSVRTIRLRLLPNAGQYALRNIAIESA
jgi:putative SOS response-associated peptidase YedK